MHQSIAKTLFALVVASPCASWFIATASLRAADAGQPALEPCSLISQAEVEQITGQREYTEPDAMPLLGGSSCTFNNATIYIFSGEKADEQFNALLKQFGHENETRHPISGLGDSAYAIYPKPRNKYQDSGAFVVVKAGRHTIVAGVTAPDGKTAESMQPQAITLAKLLLTKLP